MIAAHRRNIADTLLLGTSIGKFPQGIAEDIIRASLADNRIAVVCSARSTGKKVEGTTSR